MIMNDRIESKLHALNDNLDACDLMTVLSIIADAMNYSSIEIAMNESQMMRDIIESTQSNAKYAYDAIPEIESLMNAIDE